MTDLNHETLSNDFYRSLSASRRWKMKREYGLGTEAFLALVFNQGGRCAICEKRLQLDKPHTWSIDYDAVGKYVRGVLCRFCICTWPTIVRNQSLYQRAKIYFGVG